MWFYRSISAPVTLLNIPVIMARYENVINNRQCIAVAICHMVVGLRSITILPLASTYFFQKQSHDWAEAEVLLTLHSPLRCTHW